MRRCLSSRHRISSFATVGDAWSYFTTYTRATGTLRIGLGSQTQIEEEYRDHTKHLVVSNDSEQAVYVRAKSFSGSRYPLSYSSADGSWQEGSDGYYYYNGILPGTVIGEDGGNLSQGQKQLLCITRVMLCLPPMLILDEATSSIDTRTEIRIQKAFAAMMEGRTSFIVAHRLSTIREADVILVMKDGNIIEQGNHETLLGQNGFYATLYNSQFVGYGNS